MINMAMEMCSDMTYDFILTYGNILYEYSSDYLIHHLHLVLEHNTSKVSISVPFSIGM